MDTTKDLLFRQWIRITAVIVVAIMQVMMFRWVSHDMAFLNGKNLTLVKRLIVYDEELKRQQKINKQLMIEARRDRRIIDDLRRQLRQDGSGAKL
ncbi:MAG: hypothetical protein V4671_21400 [Armatimonadota bacterium]